MISWVEIVLLLLKVARAILEQINQDKWVQAGYDKAIAEAAQDVLVKTRAGKAILEKVNAMSDKDVDDALHGLEPR